MPKPKEGSGLFVDGEEVDFDTFTLDEAEYIERHTGVPYLESQPNTIAFRRALIVVMRRRKGDINGLEDELSGMTIHDLVDVIKPPQETPTPTRGARRGAKRA